MLLLIGFYKVIATLTTTTTAVTKSLDYLTKILLIIYLCKCYISTTFCIVISVDDLMSLMKILIKKFSCTFFLFQTYENILIHFPSVLQFTNGSLSLIYKTKLHKQLLKKKNFFFICVTANLRFSHFSDIKE
jgi:hypothetical protein